MSDVASQLTFRRFLDTSPRLYTVDIIETNILIQAKHSEMLNDPSGISVKPTHCIKYLKGNKYKVYPVYILDTGNNFSLFSRRQNYVKYVGVLKERANEAAECRLQPRHAWVDGNFTAIFGLGNCQPFNSVNFIISEHFILIDVSEMPRQNNLLFIYLYF